MLLSDSLSRSGALLFRWRGVALLTLVPLLALAISRGEPVETQLGPAADLAWEAACIGLVALGLGLRVWTAGTVPAGTSGRNRRGQVAAMLNTTGPYSLVRNPLYLGNCLLYLGVVLFAQDAELGLFVAAALALYYERIIAAEEAFLSARFGAAYAGWAARVPAFWPRSLRPAPAALPFRWRTALRREHTTAFFAGLGLVLVHAGQEMALGEPLDVMAWLVLALLLGQLAFVALRRRTGLLDLAGR